MQLLTPIQNLFIQIDKIIHLLPNEVYTKKSNLLHNASIGQHVRHIIELYIELNNGYESGIINYELRKRDLRIETDIQFSSNTIATIVQQLNKPNKALQLVIDYSFTNTSKMIVDTNYLRELIYNLEHTVHHMALIRVAIKEFTNIKLDTSFGVAVSTLKYHKEEACAQ